MSPAIQTETRTEQARQAQYFLPYQRRYLQDESRYKIVEKSRRIGFTYLQAYEDVRNILRQPKWPIWYSTADESAAREYILYCEVWAKVFDVAARSLGEVVLDHKDQLSALAIDFPRGGRIHALRSNPKAFRSKGGRVRLDEFAFHDDQRRLWTAARPVITWGGDLRILSTHNGQGCLYYRFLESAKAGTLPWSVHSVDITQAVSEGLADRIVGRPLDEAGRQAWLDEERANCVDAETWQQEYLCLALDEATAWLPYELIETLEEATAGNPTGYAGGPVYVGVDIGRRRDLFALWVWEQVGDVLWTREVVTLKGASFAAQDAALDAVVRRYPTLVRICMDQTGMGEKPVEDAQRRYGAHRVEGVVMTAPVKLDLMGGLKRQAEDRRLRIPRDPDIRDDWHAVKKLTTVAGNIRFDAERTEQGHADRAWGAALGVHAASTRRAPAILEYYRERAEAMQSADAQTPMAPVSPMPGRAALKDRMIPVETLGSSRGR